MENQRRKNSFRFGNLGEINHIFLRILLICI